LAEVSQALTGIDMFMHAWRRACWGPEGRLAGAKFIAPRIMLAL